MNEETIHAARRAWANDPEAAAQALLGCSAEELFITALRGCNQHRHKPGCPEAEGGQEDKKNGGSWAERWRAKSDEEKLAAYEEGLKKAEEKAQKERSAEAFNNVRLYRKRVAGFRKKIAISVRSELEAIYKEIKDTWHEKGTDFLRKSGVNIVDADSAYSKARGAAFFVEDTPSSERWPEAKADMQKGFAELQGIYKKLKK